MHRMFRTMAAAAAVIGATLWIGVPAAQAASIGGPFELVDHTGQTVTEESFDDRYLLVYFGYAYCPDICPTELLIMGQAVDELGELGDEVQPLFVTVDPARDTVEYLADYVPSFHPRLIGLTGSDEQIHAAAKAYPRLLSAQRARRRRRLSGRSHVLHLFHGPRRRLSDPFRLRPGAGEDG